MYLEAVAMLPQIYMFQKQASDEGGTVEVVVCFIILVCSVWNRVYMLILCNCVRISARDLDLCGTQSVGCVGIFEFHKRCTLLFLLYNFLGSVHFPVAYTYFTHHRH